MKLIICFLEKRGVQANLFIPACVTEFVGPCVIKRKGKLRQTYPEKSPDACTAAVRGPMLT